MFRIWIIAPGILASTDSLLDGQELEENLRALPLIKSEYIIYEG